MRPTVSSFSEKAFDGGHSVLKQRLSSSSSGFDFYQHLDVWGDDTSSSNSVDPSSHNVSKHEAYFYYHGLRGDVKPGPKLIFRTSRDVFTPVLDSWEAPRRMQLLTAHGHAKLSQNELWTTICDKIVQLLDDQQIKHTSIDLVRFRREERDEDGCSYAVTGPFTIWIGVRPGSTNGDDAFDSAQAILELLKGYDINDLDIAFRESEVRPLAGPVLYGPVDDNHPLKSVIDWVTTPLSLPIAGLQTLHMQGSLGFCFKMGEDFYGVTTRHVLFPDTEGNELYEYKPSHPKKKVVLMSNHAFDLLISSIRGNIDTSIYNVGVLERRISKCTAAAEGGDQQAAADLVQLQGKLDNEKAKAAELENFSATMKKDWSQLHKRVIGHVVWSPPITGLSARTPHGYTQDVCVIKLDKDKFLPNFRGNAVDLGTEIQEDDFAFLMSPRCSPHHDFRYPENRMYMLKDILPAAKIKEPDSWDSLDDATRFVFKRGHTTLTTIGRLNGFESRQRRYTLFGHIDSVEAAVCSYDWYSGPFSRGGDSGAAILGAKHDFVAQLTAGAGSLYSSDIAYGTPMEWLWNNVIKNKFPSAELFFDVPANN